MNNELDTSEQLGKFGFNGFHFCATDRQKSNCLMEACLKSFLGNYHF